MPKIKPEQLVDFSKEFYSQRHEKFKHLRFGQAFLNRFYPALSCPEIFYEEEDKKAASKIIDQFVDLGETLLDILWKG